MGLLDTAREFVASRDQNRLAEQRAVDASDFGFASSILPPEAAGEEVTVESAMRAAMGACIRLLADDISTLPWHAYRKTDTTREPVPGPSWMEYPTGDRWDLPESHISDAVVSLLSDGNLFVEGIPDTVRPRAITVLNPTLVDVRLGSDGRPYFTVNPSQQRYYGDKIAHLPWIRLPGEQRGLNMVDQAREFTGLELAARRWAGNFFANGATVGLVVMLPSGPKKVSLEELQTMRRTFDKQHAGNKNSHVTGFLTGGADMKDVGIKPDEAALDPLWSHVLEEAARFYHIPTHLLASTAGSNVGSNVEQRSIEYVQHAVRPIVTKLERFYSRLIPGQDTYIKFNLDALLRGDTKSRAEARAIELQNGVITRDEWRAGEDLAPAPEGEGGYLRTPNNTMTDPRIEDASKLIRAGFDPNEALAYVGLPSDITHLGFSPTTQYNLVEEEPADGDSAPDDVFDGPAQNEVSQ